MSGLFYGRGYYSCMLCSRKFLLPLALLIAALVYVSNAGDYLLFDSRALLHNPSLERLQLEPGVAEHWRAAILSTDTGPLKRSVAMFSFALEFAATDQMPARLMRLTNIALHLGIALIIYLITALLARQLMPDRSGRQQVYFALLVAGLWLLHPLHVSTVLYIVQRMTQLSALFVLLGIYCYLKLRVTWLIQSPAAQHKATMAVAVLLCTLLAALSKENGLLLPWYIALLEWLVFRWQVGGAVSRGLKYGCAALFILPVALLLLVWGAGYLEHSYRLRDFSLYERLLTQSRILWHYADWIVFADISAMGFYHDDIALSSGLLKPLTTLLSLAGWLALIAIAYRYRFKAPLLALGTGWFLLGHSMESSVIPLELVFEHRNYLPSIGPLLIVAAALLSLGKLNLSIRLESIASGACLSWLLLMLIIRCGYWQNETDLSAYQLANHPHSPRSVYYFANVHLKKAENALNQDDFRREITLATGAYEKLAQLDPQDMVSATTLFYMDARFMGGLKAAQWLSMLGKRVEKPVLTASDNNSLGLLGDIVVADYASPYRDQIISLYAKANARHPDSPLILYHWAKMTVDYLGDREKGIALMEQAAVKSPGWPAPRYQLALWHSELGGNHGIYDQLQKIMAHDRWLLETGKLNVLFSTGQVRIGG